MTNLDRLEDRILDLEFTQLKKTIARMKPKRASIPAHSTLSAEDCNGHTVWRMGSEVLPADRRLWPSEIRSLAARFDEFDEFDKQRRHPTYGYLISTPCGGVVQVRD